MKKMSLLDISSSYIIKQTFYYISYNRFISLIKYNKKYQNNLDFSLKKNIHSNKNIEKKEEKLLRENLDNGLKYIYILL